MTDEVNDELSNEAAKATDAQNAGNAETARIMESLAQRTAPATTAPQAITGWSVQYPGNDRNGDPYPELTLPTETAEEAIIAYCEQIKLAMSACYRSFHVVPVYGPA